MKYKIPENIKPWVSEDILQQMAERKKKKNTPEYKALNRHIRRNCETAHEQWLNERCAEIESHH